jgi:hypothetical protein
VGSDGEKGDTGPKGEKGDRGGSGLPGIPGVNGMQVSTNIMGTAGMFTGGGEGGHYKINFMRFEVFTALLLKIQVFWDVTPCYWVSCSQHFEGL